MDNNNMGLVEKEWGGVDWTGLVRLRPETSEELLWMRNEIWGSIKCWETVL
jgi:hypothetical protein